MGVWNDVGDNISAGDIWRLRSDRYLKEVFASKFHMKEF